MRGKRERERERERELESYSTQVKQLVRLTNMTNALRQKGKQDKEWYANLWYP